MACLLVRSQAGSHNLANAQYINSNITGTRVQGYKSGLENININIFNIDLRLKGKSTIAKAERQRLKGKGRTA